MIEETKMNSIELKDELSQNFIDFSHEANCQRAFADARDGLKPGQRACLWEMYVKGYTSNKPHVKSAKISGGTISSWWPHGDTAIYDTFARMSQNWINNIPEVDWHGANGSIQISGEAAASRYTEARLAKSTEEGLLYNIKKKNVPMKLNFSEDEEWPVVFPAIIPRLMVNGCQGIGSTIANVWLPHSLTDLANVINNYIKTGELDYSNLAPSFPTGGIIINKNEIKDIYRTGKGKVILRAKAEIKDKKILITEIPYQVYVEPLIDQIKELILKDTIKGIDNIINKSDKKKLLIEIECENNPSYVLNMLYKNTNLQKSYSANQYALVGKTPKLLNLKEYLDIYIKHNLECLVREYTFELNKAVDRLEIVEGLVKALEDIDNIIKLIKSSESSSKAVINLQKEYSFTERQAKAIVDMKLGKLANLEKLELLKEKEDLISNIAEYKNIISSENKQKEIYSERFNSIVSKYGTERKTELTQIEILKEKDEVAFVEPEKCVVVMTKNGYIKRIPTAAYRTQNRNTRGIKSQKDTTSCLIRTNTIDSLMVFTNLGKMHRLIVDNIPAGTNSSTGVPVKTLIQMESNEEPVLIYSIYRETNAKYVLFASRNGLIKKTALSEYINTKKRNGGLIATGIKENDELAAVSLINEEDLIIITKNGMSIRFSSKEVGASGRTATGFKGITLGKDDYVVAVLPIRDANDTIALFLEKGYGIRISLNEFAKQSKAGKGASTYKITDTSGSVVSAVLVNDEDDILINSNSNSVCISAKDIPISSRRNVGVIINKDKNIKSVTKI